MKTAEIVDTFNDAMRDIRYGYFTFGEGDSQRKVLAEGIMKMEKLIDPLWEILKQHPDADGALLKSVQDGG